jgi:glycosyltransferase involved in cell wall biosynthesis
METIAHKVTYLRFRARSLRWYNLPLLLKVKRIMDEESVQVVDCQLHRSTPLGVLAARLAKARPVVITTLHGLGIPDSWRRKMHIILFYRSLYRIVCVSHAVARDIRRMSRVFSPGVVTTIQNGLEYSPFLADLDAQSIQSEILPGMHGRFWFGTAGRLHEVKNQGILIEAFARAAAVIPNAILAIAGRGELEHQLKAAARRFDVADRIFFLGFRHDIPRVMRAFDVFLLPSLREALPLALLEAMASARPVIASNAGGIPEVIGDSGCAILVKPGDREGLARAMTRLYEMSPAERGEMGRRGRERVVSQFSAERMIHQYEELFADAFACWRGFNRGQAGMALK